MRLDLLVTLSAEDGGLRPEVAAVAVPGRFLRWILTGHARPVCLERTQAEVRRNLSWCVTLNKGFRRMEVEFRDRVSVGMVSVWPAPSVPEADS